MVVLTGLHRSGQVPLKNLIPCGRVFNPRRVIDTVSNDTRRGYKITDLSIPLEKSFT